MPATFIRLIALSISVVGALSGCAAPEIASAAVEREPGYAPAYPPFDSVKQMPVNVEADPP